MWLPTDLKLAPNIKLKHDTPSLLHREKFKLDSGAVTHGYFKRKHPVSLKPLKTTGKMANHIKWKGEFPQLPATVVKANDMSITDRKDVIKLYNDAITNLDTKVLPEVHFSLKTDKSRWVGLSKHRESSKVYSNIWRMEKVL